jgi:DNA-binding SARP family transcriptional activator
MRTFVAMLLLRAPHSVSLANLVDELWDEDPPRSAIPNIRTYAAQLRRLLPPDRLITTESGYRLRVLPGELDLACMNNLVTLATEALGRQELTDAAKLLELARRQWRGQPLAGVRLGRFLGAERLALEDKYRMMIEYHIRVRLTLGEHRQVLPLARRYSMEHPLRESAQELLMLTLHLSGDTVSALEVFMTTRSTLVRELGIEPSPGMRALQKEILRGGEISVSREIN